MQNKLDRAKLNLGCGGRLMPGYVNVDKFGTPDLHWDLEQFPWPWPDSSVSDVMLVHVLEHLGQQPDIFIGVMKELYRVCADGAVINIVVPHPRSDHFLADPTHVRPITMHTMAMFSRRQNLEWQQQGGANTPFALYHNVDFEIVWGHATLEEPYRSQFEKGQIGQEQIMTMERTMFNVVAQIEMTMKVIKPAA